MVADFDYQPIACQKRYRMIVLRKRVGVDKGQMRLFEEYRYFFYLTNDRKMTAEEVVFSANKAPRPVEGTSRRTRINHINCTGSPFFLTLVLGLISSFLCWKTICHSLR